MDTKDIDEIRNETEKMRCIFSTEEYNRILRLCGLAVHEVYCNGDEDDRLHCPFWTADEAEAESSA